MPRQADSVSAPTPGILLAELSLRQLQIGHIDQRLGQIAALLATSETSVAPLGEKPSETSTCPGAAP